MTPAAQLQRLRRRNALWQRLRSLPPGEAAFEATLTELAALTGWDRARLLAGLDLPAPETGPAAGETHGR